MRSALPALLAGALIVGMGGSAAHAKPRKCAGVEYSREGGYLVFGSSQILARRVTCARARRIARPAPAEARSRRYRLEGFTCRGAERAGRRIDFVCQRRKMRISFAWRQK